MIMQEQRICRGSNESDENCAAPVRSNVDGLVVPVANDRVEAFMEAS